PAAHRDGHEQAEHARRRVRRAHPDPLPGARARDEHVAPHGERRARRQEGPLLRARRVHRRRHVRRPLPLPRGRMGADAVEGARDRGVVTVLGRWSWRRRLPVILLAAALITLIELRVGVTIAHARHDVYRLPRAAVVTVVAAGVIATVAAAGLVLVPRPRGAIIVALVAGLFVAGIATMVSLGLLL